MLAVTYLNKNTDLDTKTPPDGRRFLFAKGKPRLLDLGFLEFDVLLGDRVVLAERQLVGLGTAVLAGHVEETGVGGRQKLDLDVCGFGHGISPFVRGVLAAGARENTRTRETWRDT